MTTIPFRKMHGSGNDFVIIDARTTPVSLPAARIRQLACRHTGIGFDQLIMLSPPQRGGTVRVRYFNRDGSESGACGNGARCILLLLRDEADASPDMPFTACLETEGRLLAGTIPPGGKPGINMGLPLVTWDRIPLSRPLPCLGLRLPDVPPGIPPAHCVSMGNPHAVFLVGDADAAPLDVWGPLLETHPVFPQRANISLVSPLGDGRFRLRVHERGSGQTRACGSAACATAAVLWQLDQAGGETVRLQQDGGELEVRRDHDGSLILTGAARAVFQGRFPESGD